MKRAHFITLFFSAQILFIFLHIHKHVRFVQHSFEKQRYEKQLADLHKQRDALTNQLYALQNRSDIQTFAHDQLALRPMNLKQIKKLEPVS